MCFEVTNRMIPILCVLIGMCVGMCVLACVCWHVSHDYDVYIRSFRKPCIMACIACICCFE